MEVSTAKANRLTHQTRWPSLNSHRQPTAKFSSDTLMNLGAKQEEDEMIRVGCDWYCLNSLTSGALA